MLLDRRPAAKLEYCRLQARRIRHQVPRLCRSMPRQSCITSERRRSGGPHIAAGPDRRIPCSDAARSRASHALPGCPTKIIRKQHILYCKLLLVNFAAVQHTSPVSSNFCKELDSARFYQRAFFVLTSAWREWRGRPFRCY
jgi:hypothetical protein